MHNKILLHTGTRESMCVCNMQKLLPVITPNERNKTGTLGENAATRSPADDVIPPTMTVLRTPNLSMK